MNRQTLWQTFLASILTCIMLTLSSINAQDDTVQNGSNASADSAALVDSVMGMMDSLGLFDSTLLPTPETIFPSVTFAHSPDTFAIGRIATLNLIEGVIATGKEGTIEILTASQNQTSGDELATIFGPEMSWWAVFEFSDEGYVKDDEKTELDADAMMKSLKEAQVAANAYRRDQGWPELELVGWAREPYFNDATKNLEWATLIRQVGDSGLTVNHNVRLLGRYGIMRVTLLTSPEMLDQHRTEFDAVLAGYQYTQGNTYAEFKDGDKIAEYGLTALVVGGAAAVAAKTGFFKWIWKLLIPVVIAAGAFFKNLFGKKSPKPEKTDFPSGPINPV